MSLHTTYLERACAAARVQREDVKEYAARMEAAAARAEQEAAAARAAAERQGSTEYVLAAGAARMRAYFASHHAEVARARVHAIGLRVDLPPFWLLEQARHGEKPTVCPEGASTTTDAPRVPAASVVLLSLGTALLPTHERPRWLEDWRGELGALETRWARFRFVRQLLQGMPRMAWTLRYPAQSIAGAGGQHSPG